MTTLNPLLGAGGDQLVSSGGQKTALGITAASVVKAAAGRVCRATVVVAGSSAGSVNDVAEASAASTANAVAILPTVAGTYSIDMPAQVGITVLPGSGQTIAIAFL